jgi:TRAP-type C4-dicarboxylate transport system permease small subunit
MTKASQRVPSTPGVSPAPVPIPRQGTPMHTHIAPPPDHPEEHLIHVEDDEVVIEHHLDDWLAFLVFWGMAVVVFIQFFSRYVMNDSAAWTEEIARYLLMWSTFIGAAVVTRRRTHIAVEVVIHFMPEPLARLLRGVIDVTTVGFIGGLAWFSWTITQKMAIQRMTVIDVSMNVVYAGVMLGCALMFWRSIQVFIANARRGWRVDPNAQTLIMD